MDSGVRKSVESPFMGTRMARRYHVSGRVQGVGYRYFAQRVAIDLGVHGWARNLDDGRVEVFALGTAVQLEDFEGELRVGPLRADVRGVVVEDAAVEIPRAAGFHIR
jgi:acylphosphatase